jgi:hypothetical protein
MLRRLFPLVAVAFLAACGADHKWASDEEVARAAYSPGPPTSITLITSINGRTGSGAHSALLINGSQRVLYDPAGTWEVTNGLAPERNDLHYGMTPPVLESYRAFQSNGVFYVIELTKVVSQAEADQAIAAAIAKGAIPKAYCSNSISAVLHGLPGFESISSTYFPKALAREFARLPGVQRSIVEGTTDPDPKVVRGVDSTVALLPTAATN